MKSEKIKKNEEKESYFLCFIKNDMKKRKMCEIRDVQEDGTLDLRGVIHIKPYAYYGNQFIRKVIIGSSVETIGRLSFSHCHNLEKILFEEPCQITELEYSCFSYCTNLTKIELPSSIQEIGTAVFNACPLERVILRGPCRIGDDCFRIHALTYLHIADSIQKLHEKAFYQYFKIPLIESPCKIYIRPEFHDEIKRMFYGRVVEFIGNDLEEGYVLK